MDTEKNTRAEFYGLLVLSFVHSSCGSQHHHCEQPYSRLILVVEFHQLQVLVSGAVKFKVDDKFILKVHALASTQSVNDKMQGSSTQNNKIVTTPVPGLFEACG